MNFQLSAEQIALKGAARDFACREVAPFVAQWDREERFPKELARRMGELGLMGGVVPEEYGGAALDYLSWALILEELAQVSMVPATLASLASGLMGTALLWFGTEEQRRKYLTPLAQGQMVASAAITEPQGGSDLGGMETLAVPSGDEYVVNGTKMWISDLDHSDYFITLVTTDPAKGHRGLCALVVERDSPGLSLRPFRNLLGMRPFGIGEMVFSDCRVPRANLIGAEGQGFRIALSAVENERLGCAARAVGMLQACLDASVKYAQERIVFGQPIGRYQLIQAKIADMVVGLEAARLLTYRLAWLKDTGVFRTAKDAAIAKMYASDALMHAAAEAVQIHGAYGCSDEYPVGRYFREAKIFQIALGTNEILRFLIAEHALGYRAG